MDQTVVKSTPRKKRFKWLGFIIAIFFILCPVGLYFMRGTKSFIVLSGSMSPTFEAGSCILVREKKPEEIQLGDILTYRVDANTILTHRVVERKKEGDVYIFRTQGDANNSPDEKPVTQDRIIGIAVLWVNGLGSLLLFLRQPIVITTVFALVCIFLLIPEALRTVKKNVDGGEKIDNERL